ncbi:acyl-CoA desaturase [Microbacterium mitrae]|uniref:Acyl-CoA desaturase n=1 Tax=Microbacterium mitrae TaxID=664640 RepID=A0A5C8HR37_9MICO|nr:acyl-CoA desaturase [Microbacterium mitrae]TXK06586.1 acyl-CoA desaturase [Microbacterium mitrae]
MTSIISPTVADLAPTLGPVRQTYAREGDFPPLTRSYTVLAAMIREGGLLRRTPWFYVLVAAAIAVGFAATITGAVLIGDSWFQLLPAAALGILFTQVAFLAHEAAHRQILTAGPANDRLARVLIAIVGMSYAWWDSKHTRHHANPNRAGKDPDIALDTISFLEDDARTATGLRRLITRKQGWLFFPLLTLEGLNLHVHSVRHLARRAPIAGRWTEISLLAVRSVLVFGPIFLFLPLGKAFAFVGVMLAVFGVYMGAVFAPNHKGMPIIAPDARLDFFSKQVRTSRNIRGGWWATWLMGGLNYQIEHHLFPSMARPYLSQTRTIVKAFCRTEGVPYTETTLLQSYARVIAYLNDVGLAARDPFDCPVAARYR